MLIGPSQAERTIDTHSLCPLNISLPFFRYELLEFLVGNHASPSLAMWLAQGWPLFPAVDSPMPRLINHPILHLLGHGIDARGTCTIRVNHRTFVGIVGGSLSLSLISSYLTSSHWEDREEAWSNWDQHQSEAAREKSQHRRKKSHEIETSPNDRSSQARNQLP